MPLVQPLRGRKNWTVPCPRVRWRDPGLWSATPSGYGADAAPETNMRDPYNAFCTHVRMTIPGAPGGPLAGLTFAAKDNFAVAGYPTGAGSPDWLRTHGPEAAHAPAIQTLLDAGATLVGKAQMDELAFSLAGQT